MGNAKLRRLISKERKWRDKSSTKHKHKYDIDVIIDLYSPKYKCHTYYKALKCSHCNSFNKATYI